MTRTPLNFIAAAVLALAGHGAMAASSWTANFAPGAPSNCASYPGATITCSNTAAQGDVLELRGVESSNFAAGSQFAAQTITWQGAGSGLGMGAGSSPIHAMDNVGSGVEAVAMKFDTSVILNDVTLGWRHTDWDFSVFAYTGLGDPTLTGASGLKLDGTLGGSWTLVSTYTTPGGCPTGCSPDVVVAPLTKVAGTESISSTWWIVAAYADAFGGMVDPTTKTEQNGSKCGYYRSSGTAKTCTFSVAQMKDHFKLLSVAGMTKDPDPGPSVPEPTSLALVSLGLVGAVGVRRRRQRATA